MKKASIAQQVILPTVWWNPFTWFYEKKIYGLESHGFKTTRGGITIPVVITRGKVYEYSGDGSTFKSKRKFIGTLPSKKGITLSSSKQYYIVLDLSENF